MQHRTELRGLVARERGRAAIVAGGGLSIGKSALLPPFGLTRDIAFRLDDDADKDPFREASEARDRCGHSADGLNLRIPCADDASVDEIELYLAEIQTALAAIDRGAVRDIVDILEAVWLREGTAYIIGNGGSASTASHMMNDLNKFTALPGKRRFRALALTDNVPLLSAVANDIDYADVFVEPLRTFARPGDVLIAISGSGNSPNIIRAVEYALRYGIITIGLCGSPGGRLAAIADHTVAIPAARIGQQEDGHLVLNHVIATALRARIERQPATTDRMAFVG